VRYNYLMMILGEIEIWIKVYLYHPEQCINLDWKRI
jgi:hypothetical protein